MTNNKTSPAAEHALTAAKMFYLAEQVGDLDLEAFIETHRQKNLELLAGRKVEDLDPASDLAFRTNSMFITLARSLKVVSEARVDLEKNRREWEALAAQMRAKHETKRAPTH